MIIYKAGIGSSGEEYTTYFFTRFESALAKAKAIYEKDKVSYDLALVDNPQWDYNVMVIANNDVDESVFVCSVFVNED